MADNRKQPLDSELMSIGDQPTVGPGMQDATPSAHPNSLRDIPTGELAASVVVIKVGDVVAERFQITSELGQGGMGLVYRARDRDLSRDVVLKFIRRELAAQEQMVARLMDEATAAGQLKHPHIVTIFDRRRDDAYGDFLVMEYINGPNLLEALHAERGKMPVEQAVRYIKQVGSALHAAHQANILHRDVKPSNVLIDPKGNAVLADWGLARILNETGQTRSGAVIGTLDYMAPEVLRSSSNASPLSDQFSLAAMLYFLISGRSPKTIRDRDIPAELRDALMRALEENPHMRFSSVAEFLNDLPSASTDRISTIPIAARSLSRRALLGTSLVVGGIFACGTLSDFFEERPKRSDNSAIAGERWTLNLNGIEYAFRWCPPGKFTMGSPKNEGGRYSDQEQVTVEVTRGFWMQETEVTQAMWTSVMDTQPWQDELFKIEGSMYPVTNVGWTNATEFCNELTGAAHAAKVLRNKRRIRLPTEAQWEYACRAGTTTAYSFGDDATKLGEYAWFDGNANSKGNQHVQEVARKKANQWGLLDMHGNVLEWCQDCYKDELPGGRDPEVSNGSSRVLRGGSWNSGSTESRCSFRSRHDPQERGRSIGFRVMIECE